MKSVSISGSLRKNVGKRDAKENRANGMIPCVVYGGEKQYQFVVAENNFRNLLYTPEVKYVELDIEGVKMNAIVQATQFHPITDRLLHVDFLEVVDGKPVEIAIPMLIKGTSPGVLRGGKLVKKTRKLKVRGELKNIPENITVDISGLDIDTVLRVSEIAVENIQIIENPAKAVVAVLSTRNVEDTPTEETTEA